MIRLNFTDPSGAKYNRRAPTRPRLATLACIWYKGQPPESHEQYQVGKRGERARASIIAIQQSVPGNIIGQFTDGVTGPAENKKKITLNKMMKKEKKKGKKAARYLTLGTRRSSTLGANGCDANDKRNEARKIGGKKISLKLRDFI